MKGIVLFTVVVLVYSCSAPINQETINYENEKVLVGKVDWNGLTKPPYGDWFKPNYLDYVVDTTALEMGQSQLDDIEIVVFLGTWCSDSQLEVPEFYKILDYLHYDIESIEVIALEKLENTQMVSPQQEEKEYGITHVPTFIFKRSGKEVGRITEYPDKSLEKDLVSIISKK